MKYVYSYFCIATANHFGSFSPLMEPLTPNSNLAGGFCGDYAISG
jgi:hypothetical protein